MLDYKIKLVADAPTARGAAPPAVTDTRVVDITVSLSLMALALTLGYDNWRTGIAWDSTGPESGYFPFYLSVILAGASLYGLVAAWLSRNEASETFVTRAQLRRVMAGFLPTLLFWLAVQYLRLSVASLLFIAALIWQFGPISVCEARVPALQVTPLVFLSH